MRTYTKQNNVTTLNFKQDINIFLIENLDFKKLDSKFIKIEISIRLYVFQFVFISQIARFMRIVALR